MEVFLDIKGYRGLYQVSNLGNIKSLRRVIKCKSRSDFKIQEKILTLRLDKDGYLLVNLYNNGSKTYKVHRLVAESFIANPDNKNIINHKNGIRNDNKVSNLEWVTISENNIHSYRVLNRKHPLLGISRKGKYLKGTSHPSISSYNKGCRCSECKLKNTEKGRRIRNKKKQKETSRIGVDEYTVVFQTSVDRLLLSFCSLREG